MTEEIQGIKDLDKNGRLEESILQVDGGMAYVREYEYIRMPS